jgi:hypothetical protein
MKCGNMAIVRRGKDKGKEVTLSQWCNDWFSVRGDTSKTIYSVTALFLTLPEISKVLTSKDLGTMLSEFSYHFDGKYFFFRRKKLR